jgi:hypothetical protein
MSRSSDDEGPPTSIGYARSLPADSAEIASSRQKAEAPVRAPVVPSKKIFHIEESDTGVREIAASIGDAVAGVLRGRANVTGADDLLRRGRKENGTWRSEEGASASSARTHDEENGESSWLAKEAKGLIATMRRKQKRRK